MKVIIIHPIFFLCFYLIYSQNKNYRENAFYKFLNFSGEKVTFELCIRIKNIHRLCSRVLLIFILVNI